jgi:hypothetical protein
MAAKFQKRHYEFLARFLGRELAVSEGWQVERTETIKGLARLLARELERDNPRFKPETFFKAIGGGL